MLECNLAVLLAERGIRISKVSQDTGISRTTLTSLCNDYSGGIKFETLNKLCMYLDIDPSEFFDFSPYDYYFAMLPLGENPKENHKYEVRVYLNKKDFPQLLISINILLFTATEGEEEIMLIMLSEKEDLSPNEEVGVKQFINFYNDISNRQRLAFEEKLQQTIIDRIKSDADENEYIAENIAKGNRMLYMNEVSYMSN